MRTAFTFLITVHGAIHLLGFLKWSKLHAVPQLSGRTLLPLPPTGERALAAAWLVAFALLLLAAGLHALRHDTWSPVALCALTLSQGLIILAWHDAKFGTLANVLILVPALAANAHTRFNREVSSEAQALLASASRGPGSVVQAVGELTYYRWQILDLELNRTDSYEADSAPDVTQSTTTATAQTRHRSLLGKAPP